MQRKGSLDLKEVAQRHMGEGSSITRESPSGAASMRTDRYFQYTVTLFAEQSVGLDDFL